jgi:hypothetical protein
MTTVHVIPTGEPPERHALADCPCHPRYRDIPRDDKTIETVTLHRPLDDEDAN